MLAAPACTHAAIVSDAIFLFTSLPLRLQICTVIRP